MRIFYLFKVNIFRIEGDVDVGDVEAKGVPLSLAGRSLCFS
jgi:hypothetical protein